MKIEDITGFVGKRILVVITGGNISEMKCLEISSSKQYIKIMWMKTMLVEWKRIALINDRLCFINEKKEIEVGILEVLEN